MHEISLRNDCILVNNSCNNSSFKELALGLVHNFVNFIQKVIYLAAEILVLSKCPSISIFEIHAHQSSKKYVYINLPLNK